jgi:hypothetical protein
MRANKTSPGNLGYCGDSTYDEIQKNYIRAYQGVAGLTAWDLVQAHKRWKRIGSQVAKGARITGRT